MKILVINGSPKRENSDTMHMTRAFLEGISSVSENDVSMFNAVDKHIEYCTGCFACKRNGGTCVHNDDMAQILDDIIGSDLVIFSFPLYCYSMPAPLKMLVDRTMPLSNMTMEKVGDRYMHKRQKDYSMLKYVMICGCGFPNSKMNFEPMIMQFKLLFGDASSTIITVPESPLFNVAGASLVTTPFLKKLKKAGRQYAQTGAIEPDTMEQLEKPMLPPDFYMKICNNNQR